MAAPSVPLTHASSFYGSEDDIDIQSVVAVSDYGSEFDVTEINEDTLLASTLDSITQNLPKATEKNSVLPSIEFEEGEAEDADQDDFLVAHQPPLLRLAKKVRRSNADREPSTDVQSSPLRGTVEVEYDEGSRRAWSGAFPWLLLCTLDRLTTNSA